MALNRVELALMDLNQSLELEPKNFMTLHSKGLAYNLINDYGSAILMFQASLDLNSAHVPSRYHLGLTLHKNGNLNEALQAFNILIQEKPDDRLILEARGKVYQDLEEYQKAFDDFDKAI